MRVQRPPRWRGTPAPSPRSPDCSKSPELLPRVLSFHGLTKRHFTSMSPFLRSSSNSLLSQLSPFRQIHRHPSPSFSYPSTTSRSRAPIPSSSSSFHRSLESPLSCSRPSNRTSSLLSLPREKRRLFHLFFRASPSSLSAPVCCSLPSPLLHSAERRESFSTVSGTAEEEGAGKKVEKSIHLTSRAEEKMIEELERRLQGDGGGGGVAVDRRVQGEVLAVSEDFILARGLGEASVGNLVIFSSSSSPPSMGGGVSPVSTEESISQNSSCIGVIFQLLTQDLTVIGLLGTLHDRSSSSVVKPLVGDVCTLLVEKGGKEDKRFSAKNFLDISSCLSSQTSSPSPLSPLSLLSFLSPLSSSSSSSSFVSSSSSSDCATPAPANEKQWNLFSISLSSSSSPSPSISSCSSSFFSPLLSTGSAVFDTLSPLREGSSTAFLGPPGTGKTTSLLSIIASHLVSTSSSPHLGSPATSHRDNKNVFSSMSTPSPLDLETSSSSPLPSVIFLSLGTSLPSLQRWLYTLKTVALPSALSARSQQYSVGSCEDFVNLSSTNDRDMPAGKRESQQNRDGPLSHQEKEGDISPSSDLDRLIPFNLLALHVPSSSSSSAG
ncbi:signal recognition particle domain protein, partial [Cystoisospora suis]